MDYLKKIEAYVAPWYRNVPHLPEGGQRWLADNIWWIVLAFVILGAFGVLSLLTVAFVGGALLTAFGGAVGATLGGLAMLFALVTLSLAIANLVIGALAINPLKNRQEKGWTLLLMASVISAGAAVLALLLAFDLFSFIRDMMFVALGGYLLFEIRRYFTAKHVNHEATKAPTIQKTK
ncbi:MAG: hypothetical protein JWM07_284 [Candidatus Saccharibacteria bacterium]|nr:hypothetical protein [Candidatus Saccharibacteria bacterium]